MGSLAEIWQASGLAQFTWGESAMILVGIGLLYLAIHKKFEPLLLVPIGFGGMLANIPGADLALPALESALSVAKPEIMDRLAALLGAAAGSSAVAIEALLVEADDNTLRLAREVVYQAGYRDGVLYLFYQLTIASGVAPLVVFMGVGAMTDFGPLLANPRTLLLGAAAQFGIFATVLGAVGLTQLGLMDFSLAEAAAIGIIGGADGPTAIYVSSLLAPHLLGAIAVAAYSYMALVPLIQPPIMRALTTQAERRIEMVQLREVSRLEKICFPVVLLLLVALLLPAAVPLLGMFCFGNLMKESGVVDRLSDTVQKSLINITTIFLGLAVGSRLVADQFLDMNTLGILALGIVAFSLGTAAGVIMAKLMNLVSTNKLNPLIGAAGVSAVPMAARVVNKVGIESNPHNFLLMHAMGPNVAGVIGSAVAAGIMLSLVTP